MDVFDLVAKIRLDSSEYEDGVGKAKGTFSNLASGVKTGLATVAKVGATAVAAGATGVAALTKMGIEGYAQYEQLAGGVETLFKDSQGTVMKYAENAYKTSGMSANQYMETVTSFSASLIQSLDGDTAKAAEVGNMAITDMSDNANKMGTSIDMIQNAYNGFAKGNFTMLDNLKLGYGGTQEEMKRLLKDAEAISGVKYDISSFADVTEAIHVMQTEMGIAGTTSREAASTIEGSISMMKGAWQNLVVGMADENANMDVLINNFVESTATAAENLLPRIEQTLSGIGALIEKLAPVIGEAVPRLVESVLPSLLSAGISLITALVSGIISAAPGIYQALLEAVFVALTEVFGMSETSANTFVGTIDGIIQDLVAFFQAGFDAIAALFNWLVSQAQTEGTFFNMVWENIKTVVSAAVDVIKGVIEVFTAVLQGDWSKAWEAVKKVLNTAWEAIKKVIGNALDWIKPLISNALDAIKSAVSNKFDEVKSKISSVFDSIKQTISKAWDTIKTTVSNALTAINNTVSTVWNAIKNAISDTLGSIKDKVSTVWEAIKTAFSTALDSISSTVSSVWDSITSVTSSVWDGIKSTISGVWDGITTAVSSAIDGVESTVSGVWETIKSTTLTVWEAIKSAITSPINDAWETVSSVVGKLKNAFDFEWSLPDLKLPHISVSGGEAPYGIGGKGKLPSFSIEWYKKAYDRAMILSKPTIFGYSNGSFLGGGDGNGNEIVAGESHLMGLIGHVVESKTAEQNEKIVALLSALVEVTAGGNKEMVRAIMSDRTFAVGEREFARLVKTYA